MFIVTRRFVRHPATLAGVALGLILGVLSCGSDSGSGRVEIETLLYVANSDNTISVIDLKTRMVTETITLDAPVSAIRLHPYRSSFYVVQPDLTRVAKLLQRNASTLVSIPMPSTPTDLSFATGSTFWEPAFVTLRDIDSVAVLRLAEDRVQELIAVGDGPTSIRRDDFRARLYVINELDATLTVLKFANNTVFKTIPIGVAPRRLAFAVADPSIYITDMAAGKLLEIDLTELEPVEDGEIDACSEPFGVALPENGQEIYVTCSGEDSLLIINVADPNIRTTVPTGSRPTEILVHPKDGMLYVANSGESSISVVNPVAGAVIATIPVGPGPRDLEFY